MSHNADSVSRDNPQSDRKAFRISCGNEVPRSEDIRRFRKPNREAIQKTLEKVLQFARLKVAEAWSPSNPFRVEGARPTTPLVATEPDEAQIVARRKASNPLDKATYTDGMSM